MISGSLPSYYRDEIVDVDDSASESKLFEYKTGKLTATTTTTTAIPKSRWISTIIIPTTTTTPRAKFKHWSHYSTQIYWFYGGVMIYLWLIVKYSLMHRGQKTVDMLIEHHNNIMGVNFIINSTKIYVPIVILSIHDHIIRSNF